MDLFEYEKDIWSKGYTNIAGIDEAGRGPLIGAVVAAAVVLPHDFVLEGLTDSKKLTEKKRDLYYNEIYSKALSVGIGIVDEKEINDINIYQASKKAMTIAIKNLNISVDYVLVDAIPLDLDVPSLSIIKGDAKSISIAAASVIAKVTRDKMMYKLDAKYPLYNFKNNKGYATKKHIEAINKYGVLKEHRRTFSPIKELIKKD